jgi:hypothetical protein
MEASSLPVTEGAIEALKNYANAETVLRTSFLPESRIIERLRNDIASFSGSADVARVISQLADSSASAAAYRWLSMGKDVSDLDLSHLGLRNRLDSDEMALAAVRAIAKIIRALGGHWVILIDQLEHLTRIEDTDRTQEIQDSIKSFLTSLVPGHGAIIAGHLSGWHVYEDFEKRFLQPIIELPTLNTDEARRIINTYLEFHGYQNIILGREQLEDFAIMSNGNMRTLLVLCHTLFRSLGVRFGQANQHDIDIAFREVRNIRDPEAIEEIVTRILTSQGVRFETQVDVNGVNRVSFAVPGQHAPQAFIMIESCTLGDEASQLRRLIDRGSILSESFPRATVVLIITGYVTAPLIHRLRDIQFEVFDGTSRSFEAEFALAIAKQTVWKHWLRRRRLYQSALMC